MMTEEQIRTIYWSSVRIGIIASYALEDRIHIFEKDILGTDCNLSSPNLDSSLYTLKFRDRSSHQESATDHLRVVLRGEGLTRAANNEQSEFIIDGSDVSKGVPFPSLAFVALINGNLNAEFCD